MTTDAARDVSSIMQGAPRVVGPGDRLDLANVIMKLGVIRHLPVVEDGILVGIVSHRDLLAAALSSVLESSAEDEALLRAIVVADVMTRDPYAVRIDTSLGDAAALLLKRRVGCLPVVDDERRLIGLISETDLLRAAYEGT